MNFSKKIWKYYLPVVIWAGVIFYFSGIPALSTGVSSISLEIFLRKGAHLGEYGILFWLIWRIFYICEKYSLQKSFWGTIILTAIYSLSDEIHQTFVLGRSGKAVDVFYDVISALLGFQIIYFFIRRKISGKIIIIFLLTVGLLLGIELGMANRAQKNSEKGKSIQSNDLHKEADNNKNFAENIPIEESQKISSKILIDVPFTTQAPFANWDEYHEEACEEASLVMIKYFLNKKELNPEIAEKEIQNLIQFQIEKYGDYKDSSVEKLVRLGREFYGIKNLKVVYDFPKDDLKKYLSFGRPIIIPAAGKSLKNPNFKLPGPIYHNLVLTGYDKNMIITNDPGTRKGQGYKYDVDTLYGAIHDFPGQKSDITKGRKAMIIIE